MAGIRELTLDEITLVSGGNANSNFEGGPRNERSSGARNSLGRNAPTHIYSDPSTVKCANAVFSGMIGGAIKGGPIEWQEVPLVEPLLVNVSQIMVVEMDVVTEEVPVVVQVIMLAEHVTDK